MRRRILKLTASIVTLILILSFVAVLPATSQNTGKILSKLEELRGKTEGLHPPALENKVKAVMHQIEAGAFNGALNKLQNDVRGFIQAKVEHPEELIKLVDEIIDLIKGIIPPPPTLPDFEISTPPDILEVWQGAFNITGVTVTSINNFNQEVHLTEATTASGITLSLNTSSVVPPPNGTIAARLNVTAAIDATPGDYKITITGTSTGFAPKTAEIALKVIALTPPPTEPDFEISTLPYVLEVVQGLFNTTIITVTSINNFNQEVVLTSSTTASGVTLSFNASSVTPPPNGTAVSMIDVSAAIDATPGDYKITVTVTSSGFVPKSVEIALKVMEMSPPEEDKTPPTIASVIRNPETPAYNESVTVTAFVYDGGGSGVQQVTLNYSSGGEWTPVDMVLSEGLYKASIPAFAFDTTVEYRVIASDNNGNTASSILFSYKVIDPYLPLLRIDRPDQGSYLSGTVAVTVFMKDQNSGGESGFANAELSINGTVVKTWEPPASSDPDTYNWNTATFGTDGVYVVKLKVFDKAENVAEKSLTVTVDNTLPTAVINAPTDGSYLRLSVLIKVTGSDTNFDKMEVHIDDELVKTSFTSGTEILEWNTRNQGEGAHSITLAIYDKAGNKKQALVNVTTDNTPPLIGTPSWSPKEPAANENIQVNVTVTEPAFGSGVKNVTLWYKNTTMGDYKSIPMEFKSGNWTATLKDQSDTKVRFFIQAIDKAGNSNASTSQDFSVAGPPGFPLIWILLIIAVILAASGAAIYYMGRKRKKSTGSSPTTTAMSKPTPPPRPASMPVKKTPRRKINASFNK